MKFSISYKHIYKTYIYVHNPSMICMYMIVLCIKVVSFTRLTKTGDDTGSTLLVFYHQNIKYKLNPPSKYCCCLQHLSLWPKAVSKSHLPSIPSPNKNKLKFFIYVSYLNMEAVINRLLAAKGRILSLQKTKH